MIHVLTLCCGERHRPDQAARLHKNLSEATSIQFRHVIYTDHPASEFPIDCVVKKIPHEILDGFWHKFDLFDEDFFDVPVGDVVFSIDTDVVFPGSADRLLSFKPNNLTLIKAEWLDPGRSMRLNSSIMCWKAGDTRWIKDHFYSDLDKHVIQYPGDEWIITELLEVDVFPLSFYSAGYGRTAVPGKIERHDVLAPLDPSYDAVLFNGPVGAGLLNYYKNLSHS